MTAQIIQFPWKPLEELETEYLAAETRMAIEMGWKEDGEVVPFRTARKYEARYAEMA